DSTMSSYLQRIVGSTFRVVNAGVGGFSGEQALQMANRAVGRGRYEALIYVAFQDDFMRHKGVPYSVQAAKVLEEFSTIKDRFGGKVLVIFMPFMEYSLDDVLQKKGWYREMVAEVDRLRKEMPVAARNRGFEFIDGTAIIED